MQTEFLTLNERALIDFLRDRPEQYGLIVSNLQKKMSKSTINNLLKTLEGRRIFRVEARGKIFYRLNIFPAKIQHFFQLIDYLVLPDAKEWMHCRKELLEMKNEVLRRYPNVSFEQILKKWIAFYSLTKPEYKGLIKILRDFEGVTYDFV